MDTATFQNLVARLDSPGLEVHSSTLTDEEIAGLTPEQAQELVALYGSNTLVTLPEKERKFFEWLREHDEPVWNDLWGDEETPYKVSLNFLPDLLPNKRGFLICDLAEHQNFFFTAGEITKEDGAIFVEAALNTIESDEPLSMEQVFMMEVWRGPIDQWRFAYLYNTSLEKVKMMVIWLIREGMLRLPVVEDVPESEESGADEASFGEATEE